jgi:hypothetical protein
MRRILVEHARRYNLKRGGPAQHVSLEEAVMVGVGRTTDLVALDDAMDALASSMPVKWRSSKCASLVDSAWKGQPKCSKYRQ